MSNRTSYNTVKAFQEALRTAAGLEDHPFLIATFVRKIGDQVESLARSELRGLHLSRPEQSKLVKAVENALKTTLEDMGYELE